MDPCSVTLTANAGIVLEWWGHVLWADALHTHPAPGFSAVTPALWAEMKAALPPPELLFFTHCHPDHYDPALTAEALALWPAALPVLPKREFSRQAVLRGASCRLDGGGVTLDFFRLPHEGAEHAGVPHYGLLLSGGGSRILLAGDGEIASPALTERLAGRGVDAAVLDFPWLTLRRGREYVEEVLRPKHLLLCHLPFPADDRNGYLDAARRAAEASKLPDVRLLTRAMQREELE